MGHEGRLGGEELELETIRNGEKLRAPALRASGFIHRRSEEWI